MGVRGVLVGGERGEYGGGLGAGRVQDVDGSVGAFKWGRDGC